MKDKFGVIGVGQAGSNICREFEELGYKCIYINTAQEDLDVLKTKSKTIHIEGTEGGHGDRNYIKQAALDSIESIVEQVNNEMNNKEFCIVCYSSSGTTGSALGGVIAMALQSNCNKISIPAIVVPTQSESITKQRNCYHCLCDLEKILCGAYFLLDNSKADKFEINKTFANLFDGFISNIKPSLNGNIDNSEIRYVLSQKGYSMILNGKDVQSIVKNIDKSIYVTMQHDKMLKYVIVNMESETDTEKYLIDTIGIPIDIFKGYNDNSTSILLNGLNLPMKRIDEVKSGIITNKDRVFELTKEIKTSKLEDDIDFLIAKDEEKDTHKDIRSLLNSLL